MLWIMAPRHVAGPVKGIAEFNKDRYDCSPLFNKRGSNA